MPSIETPRTRLLSRSSTILTTPRVSRMAPARGEVREDLGPHLLHPGKVFLHGLEDEILPPLAPLLALFPRGEEVVVVAEEPQDGLHRGHVLLVRLLEDEGNHRGLRVNFLHP